MSFICLDGKFFPVDQPVLKHDNRGFRYGDGLFETMKMYNGQIALKTFHFERLFSSLDLLKYRLPAFFNQEKLEKEILLLCKKNNCEKLGRVRLTVYRGDGGLYDENKTLNYLIESWPLDKTVNNLNENGLVIDIYPEARKSCDVFSRIKSANFLPYAMAAIYAKERQLNDCLVLNADDNIADSAIANVFIIREKIISTPPLTQGCINGVMRRWLLEKFSQSGYDCREAAISTQDVYDADEIFLTNAINGIRWVGKSRDKMYSNELTRKIYNDLIKTMQ
ncbi:MAG: aminotransferase class IV [Bacteroidota bacterium]